MKRFWKNAEVIEVDGFAIALDGRPLKTPARAGLAVPTAALAEAIAGEWRAAPADFNPPDLPLTGLANAAIDRVAADPRTFAADLAKYAETDLLCYRAESPAALVACQDACWGPLVAWARRRYDVDFTVVSGITHAPQPPGTVDHLTHAVKSLDPFRLAGLSPLVTIGGSLVAALSVLEGAVPVDEAWDAVTLDERWQAEHWGADAEAEAAQEGRRRDFALAALFLRLLD